MSTDGGDDNITGGTGTDIISSGAGNDTVTGNAGVKTIGVGAGNDTVVLNAVAGTSSDSATVVGGTNADTGQHTITGLTFGSGTDKITVIATNINSFVHATDTDVGLGSGTDTLGTAESFTTKTGLIEFDLASGSNNANFKDVGDLVITLDSAVSESNFEAHLAYDLTSDADGSTLTGGGLADTLTGGAGADTITGGVGVDIIDGKAGDDVIVVGASHDGTGESYTGGDGTGDTLQVDAAANFSNDTVATLEVLDLHEDGTAVAITMTEAQVDGFTTIRAAASAIGSGDKITLSDAMDADMLDGTVIGTSNEADEVIFILADVASNALTLVDATMAQATDKLFIDGSNLTGTNALTFNGAAEDDAAVMTITGGAAADTITGGDGADVITGGGGADIINGDAGNDVIHFGAADTGIGTIGDSAKSMLVANLDIITAAAGDVLNLSVLLETEGNYDNLDEHSAATSIDTTLTTQEVAQYVGTYDSATGKFLSTSTAASSSASTTDVDALLFAAANANSSDTTATDFFVVVGVSAQGDSAIADGVITLA
jgi:Ca2+-binding RTX toxin-like protein